MSLKNLNKKGFTAIEAMLAVVMVAIIAFVGYYVYHTQSQSNKTLASATQVANSSPAKGSTKKVTTTTPTSTQKYFIINEWGIRAPYSGILTLQYGAGANSNTFDVSSTQLDTGGPSATCALNSAAAGYIQRYLPTDEIAPSETIQSFVGQDFAASNSQAPIYAKVNGYYYIYYPSTNSSCSNQQLLDETIAAFTTLVPKLQAVTQ